MASTVLYTLCVLAVACHGSLGRSALRGMFPDKYPPMKQNGVDPGQPVFLTPYIEKGQFQEGTYCVQFYKFLFYELDPYR